MLKSLLLGLFCYWQVSYKTWRFDTKSPTGVVLLLTGELLKEQEHLRQLIGDSVEEQRRKKYN